MKKAKQIAVPSSVIITIYGMIVIVNLLAWGLF